MISRMLLVNLRQNRAQGVGFSSPPFYIKQLEHAGTDDGEESIFLCPLASDLSVNCTGITSGDPAGREMTCWSRERESETDGGADTSI